jgi:hypothetical protein
MRTCGSESKSGADPNAGNAGFLQKLAGGSFRVCLALSQPAARRYPKNSRFNPWIATAKEQRPIA